MNRLMSKDRFVFIDKKDEDIETIRPSGKMRGEDSNKISCL